MIGKSEIAEFEKDGAACLRGVIDGYWIERMREAIDVAMRERKAPWNDGAGFYNGFFHWLYYQPFRDLIFDSVLGEVAACYLRAQAVNFLYDQLMVKEADLVEQTPWHLDSRYFPISGGKTLSIWIPFDRATPESGAVTYIRGSQKWRAEYGQEATMSLIAGLPKPGEAVPEHELLAWNLDPGDVLIHHVDIVHCAPKNTTGNRRRALATRWTDQDVKWAPREDDFFFVGRKLGMDLPMPNIKKGDPLSCELFPTVWPRACGAT